MKTAMQELIELIENGETDLYLIENHKQIWLEREKEQIINAYDNGSDVNDDLKPLYGTPEQYYAEKYNNK